MSRDAQFEHLVTEALNQQQHGWDFSFVADRMIEDDLDWNYLSLAGERLGCAAAAIDLCSGGGELLSTFNQLPDVMYATEDYKPNLSLAKSRLLPLGVKVVSEETRLPGSSFDLVLCRHGRYDIDEIRRIAKPGATFLTQQVSSANLLELNQLLGLPSEIAIWNLGIALSGVMSHGFEVIEARQARLQTRFTDVGAIIFYLNAVPWQVPDFNLQRSLPVLRQLHDQIEDQGPLLAFAERFLIEVKRQA